MLTELVNNMLPKAIASPIKTKDSDDVSDDGYVSSNETTMLVADIEKELEKNKEVKKKSEVKPKKKRKKKEEEDSDASFKKQKFSIQKTVIKNVVKEMIGDKKSISHDALTAIRVAAEKYLIDFFESTQTLATLNNRKTVTLVDLLGVQAVLAKTSDEHKDVISRNVVKKDL